MPNSEILFQLGTRGPLGWLGRVTRETRGSLWPQLRGGGKDQIIGTTEVLLNLLITATLLEEESAAWKHKSLLHSSQT